MSNINDTFFDGHYKEIWKTLIPDELTVKEVDFMVPHFGLQPGSKVLDLMCGYGRHAIALAKKGIVVTAVDNLGDYIDEIKLVAEKDNLPLQAVKHDVITYPVDADFDLAICMGKVIFQPAHRIFSLDKWNFSIPAVKTESLKSRSIALVHISMWIYF